VSGAGTLVIVGTGIKAVGHLTADARHWIARADKLLHVVADPVIERSLIEQNPSAESLRSLYGDDRRRSATYAAMVERILAELAPGRLICAVFYGHPGVFVRPSHVAIARARAAGHVALMLPGISAEDCLIADLGVDPACDGWQTFEATDFLIHDRKFDPRSSLVLWQIGAIGELGLARGAPDRSKLAVLVELLAATYGGAHEVVVYEAAAMPTCDPLIHRTSVERLLEAPITVLSTLYVPPRERAKLDLDRVRALGLSPSDFGSDFERT
jgi:uncharacterized protein YabN with tetrapyrrole methylase and pyrophosphatase domain